MTLVTLVTLPVKTALVSQVVVTFVTVTLVTLPGKTELVSQVVVTFVTLPGNSVTSVTTSAKDIIFLYL